MLTDGRFEVLAFGKTDILPPGVAQDIAEEFHTTTAFLSKVNRVSRPIHLTLRTGRSLEANHGSFRLSATVFDIGAKRGVTSVIAELRQLFEGSLSGNVGITSHQLRQGIKERIELRLTSQRDWSEASWRRIGIGRLGLCDMLTNDSRDGRASQLQVAGDTAYALLVLPACDDVVLCKRIDVHGCCSSLMKSVVASTRMEASFWSLRKLGKRTGRSQAWSSLRPVNRSQ